MAEQKIESTTWPRYPSVLEINAWVWLSELSEKLGRAVDLGSVPTAEWDAIADFGFDAVWLMGVWERSPAGIAIANRNAGLLESLPARTAGFPAGRTMSDRLTASAVMLSMDCWAGRRSRRRPRGTLHGAVCA